MISRTIALAACALLCANTAFAQVKSGITAKIDIPAEISLGMADPETAIVPVRVTARFADGKKYNGMLDLYTNYACFVDEKGKEVPKYQIVRLKFHDGVATARLKPNYAGGEVKIFAQLGIRDTEVVGKATSFVRVPTGFAVVEEKTRRVALADGKDHPVVTLYVKDQKGKPMPDCETSADCQLLNSKVTARTDAKGFARLNIPPCKKNMLVSCGLSAGFNTIDYLTLFYADNASNTYGQDGLFYKATDVKLAEKMIADKFYDAAIRRLSFTAFSSGPSGMYVSARAQILLCNALAAKGEADSAEAKMRRDNLKENLTRIWTDLTVQEPNLKKRLHRMDYIFEGQPQGFADFIKPMLKNMTAKLCQEEELVTATAFLDYYQKLGVVDLQAVREVGNVALRAKIAPTTQPLIASLIQRVYSIYPACFSDSDEQMAKALVIRKDYSGAEKMIAAVFKLRPKELSSNMLMSYIRMWLLGINDRQTLVRMYRASLSGDIDEGLRWAQTDDVADQLFELKRYSEALAEYTKVAEIEQKGAGQPLALYKKALCYKEMGNTAEAAKLFQELADTDNYYYANDAVKQLYLLGVYKDKPAKPTEAAATK